MNQTSETIFVGSAMAQDLDRIIKEIKETKEGKKK